MGLKWFAMVHSKSLLVFCWTSCLGQRTTSFAAYLSSSSLGCHTHKIQKNGCGSSCLSSQIEHHLHRAWALEAAFFGLSDPKVLLSEELKFWTLLGLLTRQGRLSVVNFLFSSWWFPDSWAQLVRLFSQLLASANHRPRLMMMALGLDHWKNCSAFSAAIGQFNLLQSV